MKELKAAFPPITITHAVSTAYMNDELIKGIEAMGRSVGLGGLAVVPPDLHLVKPVTADAEEMREMTSDDRDNARRALSSDLEGQTWNAIVDSLKQVR